MLLAAAVARGALLPGAVNENPPHRLRCRGKKMRAVLEFWSLVADESQPGLVDQRGRLKGMPCGFVGHLARRKAAQFFIDQWQQLIAGFGVAAFNGVEQKGSLTHASRRLLLRGWQKSGQLSRTFCPASHLIISRTRSHFRGLARVCPERTSARS